MAKTLNSIWFTTLLLVVLFISAEMPKSEAKCDKYLGEVTVPHPCKERVCEAQCHEHYENACKGECEDHDDGVHVHDNHDHDHEHCYCYGNEEKCDKYLGEVTVPQPCKEHVCEAQCHEHYEHVCKGECKEHDDGVHVRDNHDHDHEHCYCYGRYY